MIPFVGLKIGTHRFEFELDKSFFASFEGSPIDDATVQCTLVLEKKETMMIATYSVSGTVDTACDRCNDPIAVPVNGEMRIIYKFGNETSEDENLIVLEPDAYELDVAPQLYELLVISLPIRILHPEGGCNEEVMELYNSLIINAGEPDELDDEDWDDESDEEWDDENWGDDDENELDDSDEGEDTPDDDKPIDPRWAALKNLN
jgi:uncharacterized metal-binding protein YceD (DUF177 family)